MNGFEIPIYESDLVPPGQVLIFHPDTLYPPLETPLRLRLGLTFRQEIRQIVRDGLSAAFPDLVLPPEKVDLDLLMPFIAETRLAMSVLNPRDLVRITGI